MPLSAEQERLMAKQDRGEELTREEFIAMLDLDAPPTLPTKTFKQLLAEGVPHKGGLAQLASAEDEQGNLLL